MSNECSNRSLPIPDCLNPPKGVHRIHRYGSRPQRLGYSQRPVQPVGFVSIADLHPALKSYRSSFPLVEVQLHELTTDAQVQELRAARLDLGIGLAPVAEPDLEFESILREELLLAIPSGHPQARGGEAINLRTFAEASFIIPPRELAPGLYDLIISHCRALGFTPRITQQARQMQTVIGLVPLAWVSRSFLPLCAISSAPAYAIGASVERRLSLIWVFCAYATLTAHPESASSRRSEASLETAALEGRRVFPEGAGGPSARLNNPSRWVLVVHESNIHL